MATYIALLRAVNVGGTGMLPMADLRRFFATLGYPETQTVLQSGNVVFRAPARSTTGLERLLEAEAAARLGIATAFMVRTAAEWRALVAANPFAAAARDDPARLLVMFLKASPEPRQVKALQAAITGREEVRVKGQQAYVTYPDGSGKSKLTNAVLERALGSSCTGRNWNTVLKLAALVNPS
jgi:uncharacterized protein (DUF1697 family)